VGNGCDLEVKSEAIYQRGNLFDDLKTVVLLNLAELRALDHPMDNCSSRVTSEMIGLYTSVRVRVITVAPPTTPIFQVLNMVFSHESDRERPNESILRLQTNNGGFQQMKSFTGTLP
jgi:hypothetical protein